MATTNRLKIIIYGNELDYKSAEDLGIKFNRITDDLTNLSNKFGDFSYSFDVPITKNNSTIFGYANAHGKKNIFKPNRDLPCKVYNNDGLLLDGVISLEAVTRKTFTCVLYSKLKEFSDTITDKKLKDLEFDEIIFDYENTIINHINAGYSNSDEALYQFPFIYYGTVFTPFEMYNESPQHLEDFNSNEFDADTYPVQQYYYALNTPDVKNVQYQRFYHHQFPPVFYIVRIMEQIFKDASWTLGGQFFNDDNIKKIVMTYAGENDIYDQATGEVNGTDPVTLQPAKLLPDMEQSEFLNGIINMFNLYFKIDIENKIIKFETYNKLFTDVYNPYDITTKVDFNSIAFSYANNNDPTISFEDAENMEIMGDNMTITGDTTNAFDMSWHKTTNKNIKRFFNREGTTDEIQLPFAAPAIKRTYLWNDENDNGTETDALNHIIFQPIMSVQTPTDNNNQKFNKNDEHDYVFNTEDTIKYKGKPTLMYYYGESASDIVQKTGEGSQSTYFYINIFTGGTQNRVPVGFCSPMQLSTYRDVIDTYLNSPDEADARKTITATYLQTIWNMMSTQAGAVPSTTDYSLVFDDVGYFHKTLWTKFHKNKYDRYKHSEMLFANMRMNNYDWDEMKIDRPIKYNNEIYHLVEISGYDPIKRTAQIILIKTI